MTIENKYAFVKISLFGVGVKLCFIHIKSVVILSIITIEDEKHLFQIHASHQHPTHKYSQQELNVVYRQNVYLQLVTMLILIIWHLLKKITSIEYYLCPDIFRNCCVWATILCMNIQYKSCV